MGAAGARQKVSWHCIKSMRSTEELKCDAVGRLHMRQVGVGSLVLAKDVSSASQKFPLHGPPVSKHRERSPRAEARANDRTAVEERRHRYCITAAGEDGSHDGNDGGIAEQPRLGSMLPRSFDGGGVQFSRTHPTVSCSPSDVF